jgi:hypothetical protein
VSEMATTKRMEMIGIKKRSRIAGLLAFAIILNYCVTI